MASVSQKFFLLALAVAAPASHAQDTFTLADYKNAQASDVDGTCVGKECLLRTDAQDGEVLLQSDLRTRLGSREAAHNGILEPSFMQTKKRIPSSSEDSTHGVDGAITVECQFFMVEEDRIFGGTEESDGLQYGTCRTDDEMVYYVEDDDTTENMPLGYRFSLQLVESISNEVGPWTTQGKKLYSVVNASASVVMSAQEVAAERRVQYGLNQSGTKVAKILVLLLKFSEDDFGYHVDETTAMEDLFALPEDPGYRGSFAEMISRSSYGQLILDKSSSTVLTVQMGTAWADEIGCDYESIATRAFKLVKERSDVDVDPGSYDFREMYIPFKPDAAGNDCGWNGLAWGGCGHPSLLPNPGGCRAWRRSPHKTVTSHELGHNLGLAHADGPVFSGMYMEYRDPQASMSNSARMSSFIAAAREQMGFISVKEGEVIEWKSWYDDPVTIGSISLPLNQPGAGFVAVKWECPECIPKTEVHQENVGGYLWLQFRGDEGYSSLELSAKYQNKVYVHLARRYSTKILGKGSELWAILDEHDSSYTPLNSAFSVQVCSITGDVAKVSLGKTLQEAQSRCKKAASRAIPEANVQHWCYADGGITAGYDDGSVFPRTEGDEMDDQGWIYYTTESDALEQCNNRFTCAGYEYVLDNTWRLLISDSYVPGTRYFFATLKPGAWHVLVRVKAPCTPAPAIWIPFSEMTASQSGGGAADKCLTDKVEPTWPGSCTWTGATDKAWWKVSLPRLVNVQSVSLTNRADCCAERLQNVDIFVGGKRCASVTLDGGETRTISCEGSGSEVKVQHTGSMGLTICGFKLFGSGGGGEAYSCTTGETTSCQTCKVEHERTVDNHCDTCNPGYSLIGTSCEACDLWTFRSSEYLEKFATPGGKYDCFDEEEAKYECFNTYANNCGGITKQLNECDGNKWTLRVGTAGIYVDVKQIFHWPSAADLTSYLLDRRCEATCEVYKCQKSGWVKKNSAKHEAELNDRTCCEATCEVYKCQTSGWVKKTTATNEIDVDDETCCEAPGIQIPFSEMTPSQSGGADAHRCLTDDVNPEFPGSCTFTGITDKAWWKVSLPRLVNVKTVSLTNRDFYDAERLQNVDIFVGGKKCASASVEDGETQTFPCEGWGSEVKVQHTGSVGLTICGFKLFGTEEECALWTYLPGQWLSAYATPGFGADCFDEEEAKDKCLHTYADVCNGITQQWNVCDGNQWTLRKGNEGKDFFDYDESKLKSYLLNKECKE